MFYVNLIKEIFRDALIDNKIDYKKVIEAIEVVYSFMDAGLGLYHMTNNLRSLTDYTYFHSVNTAIYTMLIGQWSGFTIDDIKKLGLCGLLHDIGKSKIPQEIINKKVALTEVEMEIMKRHPILGYEILKNSYELSSEIKEAVLLHHERLDGSGYPFGIGADGLKLSTRIVAVADVFDAMTSDRAYKKSVSPDVAIEMLKNDCGRFDKNILDILARNFNADFEDCSISMVYTK